MGKVLNDPNTPFRQHLQRLWIDVRYPFRINPLAHKPRKGWQDFLHALVNIPVETCRSFAYEIGHLIFYLVVTLRGGVRHRFFQLLGCRGRDPMTDPNRLPKAVTRKSRLRQPSTWAGFGVIALSLSQLPDILSTWGERLDGAFGLGRAEWLAVSLAITLVVALAGFLAIQLNEG